MTKDTVKSALNAYVVCASCGSKHGRRPDGHPQASTWHKGKCDICHRIKAVTEFRDYGYAKYPFPKEALDSEQEWV